MRGAASRARRLSRKSAPSRRRVRGSPADRSNLADRDRSHVDTRESSRDRWPRAPCTNADRHPRRRPSVVSLICLGFAERRENYLFVFQISVASFQSRPALRQRTTYFPAICCDGCPFVFNVTVPISRAADRLSG